MYEVGRQDSQHLPGQRLIIHALSATMIFWLFRLAFRPYPAVAAFAAALSFLLNRTALVTSTIITQHLAYIPICGLTLFSMAMFCRTLDRRYWYATAAGLGLAFATVETSMVLLAAILVTLVLVGLRTGWKSFAGLLARGAIVRIGAILVIWPMGVLQLGVLKGYVYLVYIAVSKKTFSPLSARELWTFKFETYPLEFVVPLLALAAVLIWWKRLSCRKEILPFWVCILVFLAATTVVTVPYTHYHGSLLMSSAVLIGVICGELWLRPNVAARISAASVLLVTLTAMAAQYYHETTKGEVWSSHYPDLRNYLAHKQSSKGMYVPFVLVPTIHFYYPDLPTVGYDVDWRPEDLLSAWVKAGPGWELLCAESTCTALRSQASSVPVHQTQVVAGGIGTTAGGIKEAPLEPLYSLVAENRY